MKVTTAHGSSAVVKIFIFLAFGGLLRPGFAMASPLFMEDGKDGKGQPEQPNEGHCLR